MKNIFQTIKPFLYLLVEVTDAKRFMDKKKNISGKLQNTKQENPFSVPEGYFNDLQQRIQEKIKAEREGTEKEVEQLRMPRLIWISAVAAIFVIGFFIARNLNKTGAEQPLTQEEIAYAFEQEILDLDELELLDNLDEMNQNLESEHRYSEEIIMYLLDEDIEIDKIVNEL